MILPICYRVLSLKNQLSQKFTLPETFYIVDKDNFLLDNDMTHLSELYFQSTDLEFKILSEYPEGAKPAPLIKAEYGTYLTGFSKTPPAKIEKKVKVKKQPTYYP